jgi:hypothetical protein
VNTINIGGTKFQWTSDLNVTLPRNKLLSYPGLEQSTDADRYEVGQPLSIQKLYQYIAVNPTTGLYEFTDVDGNGKFDQQDRVVVINTGRYMYGGLTNTLRFRSLECSFLFQFAKQTSLNYKFSYSPGQRNNVPLSVYENRWRKDGDLAQIQKPSVSPSLVQQFYQVNGSDAAYSNYSFIRLKTFTMSYVFEKSLLDWLPISAGKIYIQGQNLFMVSNSPLLDPETANLLPPLRMITCGIDIQL